MENIHKYILLDDEKKLEAPINTITGYDYVIAADRTILRAENNFIKFIGSLYHSPDTCIRGLISLPYFQDIIIYKNGKIPLEIFKHIVELAENKDTEQVFQICFNPETNKYELFIPDQEGKAEAVRFNNLKANVVCEIHTHPNMSATPSATDNQNDLAFRIYGIIGTKNRQFNEITLRLGIYGYFRELHLKSVFEGF